MVPGRVAKGPCVPPPVLDSSSGMSVIGVCGLRCIQETRQDIQLVFPYGSEVTAVMADGWSTLLTQQTHLLTASVLTLWALVGIKLV